MAGVLTAGAAAAGEIDKAKLDQVRSLTAEGAFLEQSAAQGRVTATFAETLRGQIRDELQKLTKDPEFGATAEAALQALAGHDARRLSVIRDQLAELERSHGRAG
jgi:hypothetical protein